jgi:biopolymer transport protein ExbD
MNRPDINVTPLIDVLLVLLIIFMVVAPIRPSSFKTRIPAEPDHDPAIKARPDTLVAIIGKDRKLRLNNEPGLGTPEDALKLTERLRDIFRQRSENGSVSQAFADEPDRPVEDRIERAVFIKAPPSLDYGSVARVVDAVKVAGAYPISLQIDDLDLTQ